MKSEIVIWAAYHESVLSAVRRGLKGRVARIIILGTTAKLAGALLKRAVTLQEIRKTLAAGSA